MRMRLPGLAAACLLAGAQAAFAAGDPVAFEPCADAPAQVAGASREDRQVLCKGAGDALAFFASRGLRTETPLRIRVTSELPEGPGKDAAGCFLERSQTIFLLPYAGFSRKKTWFKLPIDRSTYRSLAAHEVAHALAACNFARPAPPIQAKEYVAYVTMFGTMEPARRQRILGAWPAAGFESADRLSQLLYLFDPMRFGVESWRHFARPDNGDRFLRRVLAGEEFAE